LNFFSAIKILYLLKVWQCQFKWCSRQNRFFKPGWATSQM